ncbi:MAG: TonB-dependent receptor [Candidatus Aminicenantales bacterium]
MSKKVMILVLIACVSIAGLTFAQLTQEGRINGKVVDKQGAPLPGVSVEAISPKLIGKAVAITDATGVYRLMALPSGTFEITFKLQGFKTLVHKGVILEMSQTLALNAALEEATIEEQVTVVGQSPLIDVKSTVKGQVMTKETYMTLPRGRAFDSLVATIPGVSNDKFTAGISVDGATGAENTYYADGADTTDFHLGVKGQNVVLELLDEVKVTASGYNAEFGGSMGGVINVITRAGGNEFHGDLMMFYENNSRLMQGHARDYIRQDPYDYTLWEYVNNDTLYFNGGRDRDNYNRYEGVISLGGYILKDKLWFFGSLNPTFGQTKALRDFENRTGTFSTFKSKSNFYNGSVKLSAAPFSGLRVAASYINNFGRDRGTLPDIQGTDNPDYAYGNWGYDYPNWTAALTADYSLGNNLLISYRGGWHLQNQNNQQIRPPDGTTYNFNYSNAPYADDPFYVAHPELIEAEDWTSSATFQERQKYIQEKIGNNLDFSYYLNAAGEHALKAGVGYAWLHEDVYIAATHPRVFLYFGRTNTSLGFPIGPGADPASPYYGQYGYYYTRGNFNQPIYGGQWNIHANNYSAYIQDSWTIKNRLTLNFGVRAESQYIPAFTNVQYPGYNDKPVKFDLTDALAPRLGVVYDVFGDSSLKIFGSFGIYYDVMKMYIAELTYGGYKHLRNFYALQNPDWTQIAASGVLTDEVSQGAGGTYAGFLDYLPPSFGRTDPGLRPTAQREISLGAEKRLSEDISLSVRFVNKNLLRTIEDVGALAIETDPETGETSVTENFWIVNPGYGWSLPVSQGGKFLDGLWPTPKAKRDYLGVNISLEKRFSDNWQGGINYTWSRLTGNYSGLASTDEVGYDVAGEARLGTNVQLYYDDWFIMYDGLGRNLDGPLPQDRTHSIKAFGSYALPFGLTVGVTAYGRSGLPQTTKLYMNNRWMLVNNRNDLGRLPFTFWANLFLDYSFKISGRYRGSVNLQIDNVTNTKTIQSTITSPNLEGIYASNDEILDGTLASTYQQMIVDAGDVNTAYGLWETRFGSWSARLGVKFSF